MLGDYSLYSRPLIEPDHRVSHNYKTQGAHSHVWSCTKKYTTYVAIFTFGKNFSPRRLSEFSFSLYGCNNHIPLADDFVVLHRSGLTFEPCKDFSSFFDTIVLH